MGIVSFGAIINDPLYLIGVNFPIVPGVLTVNNLKFTITESTYATAGQGFNEYPAVAKKVYSLNWVGK